MRQSGIVGERGANAGTLLLELGFGVFQVALSFVQPFADANHRVLDLLTKADFVFHRPQAKRATVVDGQFGRSDAQRKGNFVFFRIVYRRRRQVGDQIERPQHLADDVLAGASIREDLGDLRSDFRANVAGLVDRDVVDGDGQRLPILEIRLGLQTLRFVKTKNLLARPACARLVQ